MRRGARYGIRARRPDIRRAAGAQPGAGSEVFGVGSRDVDCATVEIWTTILKRLNEHWRVVRATLRYRCSLPSLMRFFARKYMRP